MRIGLLIQSNFSLNWFRHPLMRSICKDSLFWMHCLQRKKKGILGAAREVSIQFIRGPFYCNLAIWYLGSEPATTSFNQYYQTEEQKENPNEDDNLGDSIKRNSRRKDALQGKDFNFSSQINQFNGFGDTWLDDNKMDSDGTMKAGFSLHSAPTGISNFGEAIAKQYPGSDRQGDGDFSVSFL